MGSHVIKSQKGTSLRESASFEPSCLKKGINKNNFGYTHVPRSTPWIDVPLIWHSRSGRRHNHLWQIFWWSVEGCRLCGGLKIAYFHWQRQSPLTQGWRYRAACDKFLYHELGENTRSVCHCRCQMCSYWKQVHFWLSYFKTLKRLTQCYFSCCFSVSVKILDHKFFSSYY